MMIFDKRFGPLFWTQFLGAFNDNFLRNALVVLVTFRSLSFLGFSGEQIVTLSGGVFILPFVLFSGVAGQVADRYSKATIIPYIKISEIVLGVLGLVGLALSSAPILLFAIFLMGIHSTFLGPIKYSIIPELVADDDMVRATALVESGTFVAILLGQMSGVAVAARMPNGPIEVGALFIGFAFLGLWTSKWVPKTPAGDPDSKINLNPFPPTWEVLKSSYQVKPLWLSILAISWFWFFGGALLAILPSLAKDVCNADEKVLTLFISLFSIGVAVGSWICGKLSFQRVELGLVPLGSLGLSLFTLDLALSAHHYNSETLLSLSDFLGQVDSWRIILDLFMLSVCGGIFIVPLYAFLQERAEPEHRARVVAANNIVNSILMVGSAVLLMVAFGMGASQLHVLVGLAVTNLLVSIYVYSIIPEFTLRFFLWIISHVFYRLSVTGVEKIPRSGPVIVVCNHVSFLDWLFVGAAIKRPVRFVMDNIYFVIPIFKEICKQGKCIPIATRSEDPKVLEAAYERMVDELKRGQILSVFPEGQLTRDGEIHPFKPGIEKLLKMAPATVVPMAINGLWGSYFSRQGGGPVKGFPKRFRSKVQLTIGDPIPCEKVNVQLLHQKVSEMWRSLPK